MAANDDLYTKTYGGLYCVGCEQFYLESELIEGRCPEHGTVPEFIEEENYFFRLSRYQQQLIDLIESGALKIVPETRRNEVLSFVRGGLQDISFSRSAQRARGWGIPVPGDPDHVMYVWMDALTNYITALDWVDDGELYQRYWAGADERIHVVGKGVTRFHAVYWPAMLMAAGLPTPTTVVVHGYVTVGGGKLSKSTGNVVDPEALVVEQGADAVRQFLLAELSPIADGDFTVERLVRRYNADLANGLGNLVSRVTTMVTNYRDGRVPDRPEDDDAPLRAAAEVAAAAYTHALGGFDHREACQALWDFVRQANAFVEEETPWNLAKAERGGDADGGAAPRPRDPRSRGRAAVPRHPPAADPPRVVGDAAGRRRRIGGRRHDRRPVGCRRGRRHRHQAAGAVPPQGGAGAWLRTCSTARRRGGRRRSTTSG